MAALLLGAFSIRETPREEEPQIAVPMLDVFVQMPGASAAEVAQRASVPMEKLLREIPGVEYVYSISHPGLSMVTVRFYVGTNEEDAIVKTYNKLYSNFDRIPQGVSQPIIKVRSIDDVPILALTLWGKNYDAYQLRLIAAELDDSLKQLNDVSETTHYRRPAARSPRGAGHPAARGVWTDAGCGCVATRRCEHARTSAAILRATIRSSRSRPATSSRARMICSKSSWEFTRDVPCICATWPRKSKTARQSPITTSLFADAEGSDPAAPPMPNIRRSRSRSPNAKARTLR